MKFKGNYANQLLSKVKRQNEALQNWVEHKGIGTFNHCPGFGKLYEGIEVIKRMLNKDKNSIILVIVPSDIILTQWQSLFKQQIGDIQDTNVEIVTLNVFQTKDLIGVRYRLVIIDEIHKFVRLSNIDVHLANLVRISKFRLGLLGILPDKEYVDLITQFAPVIDTVSYEDAIENKWIAKFREFNLGLTLTDSDKIRYARYTSRLKDTLQQFRGLHKLYKVNGVSVFNGELDLIISCHSGKKMLGKYVSSVKIRESVANLNGWNINLDLNNAEELEIDNRWNPVNLYNNCKVFKATMDSRNEIMINNDVKLKMIVDIMKLNPVPTIIFNESIEFVERVTAALNEAGIKSVPYHSRIASRPLIDPATGEYFRTKTTDKIKIFGKTLLKRYAADGLNQGYFTCLVTVKSLDEGFNCASIEQVITSGGNTNPITYSQRIARGNRINPLKLDKLTTIINLYFEDFVLPDNSHINSRDKAKLISRQKHSDSANWVKFLHEIFG